MEKKLKIRGITAFFFVLIVLTLIYWNDYSRMSLFAAIAIGSSYEMLQMSSTSFVRKLFSLIAIAVMYVLLIWYVQSPLNMLIIGLATIVMYLILGILLLSLNKTPFHYFPNATHLYPGLSMLTAVYFVKISADDFSIILGILLLIWANDTFAYLVGRKIGKTKLHESISPNKTWEGFWGGGIATIITAILYCMMIESNIVLWIILAVIAWLLGIAGDLVQSAFKRHYGVKDSGNLLPGHGGIFDRFDSFIYIAPIAFTLINYLLEY